MATIDYIEGLEIPGTFARRKYEDNLIAHLKGFDINRIFYRPLGILGLWRLSLFLFSLDQIFIYPTWIRLRGRGKIKHLVSQELGYLLNFFNWEKSVVTVYDLIAFKKPYFNNFLYRRYLKFVEQGLKKAKVIVTISEYSKKEIVNYLQVDPANIKVVYPAVDHSLFRKAQNRREVRQKLKDKFSIDRPFLLYVGSEQKRKNLPQLVKVFREVKKQFPELLLVKVGNPQEMGARQKLLDLINKLNLGSEVLFFNKVNEGELVLFYQGAEALVFLSEHEGFGMPVLEAMACGCPVVCSNLTSLPEVAAHAASLVNPHSQEKVVGAIQRVLLKEGLKNKLVEQGKERAQSFSWEKSAADLEKIYRTF